MSVRAIARAVGLLTAVTAAPLAAQGGQRFNHEQHATFDCAECHRTGQATVATNADWCAGCHHVSATMGECSRCHNPSALTPAPLRALVPFRLSVGEPRTRSITFDHVVHGDLECADCHTGGATLAVRRGCASCHVDHHAPERECIACHAQPPEGAHVTEVHLELAGCGSAGCHAVEGIDFEALRERPAMCLSCHHAQREHEVGEPCLRCHLLGTEP